jgi:Xaa-Pro aminopeptidase
MRRLKLRFVGSVLAMFLAASGFCSALESVPKAEYHARRVALGEQLKGGVAVLFAAEEPVLDFTPYRQDSDFYYLTGWNEPGAALVVIGAGPATTTRLGEVVPAHGYREILFLPARNLIMEKYTGVKMDAATSGVAASTGFDAVMTMTALPGELTKFVAEDRRRGANMWSQMDVPAATASVEFLAASLGVTQVGPIHDVRTLTMGLRTVKSAAEIELLRKAAEASIQAQLAGMQAIKPGVRERTVAGVEVAKMMEEGCERPSYAPIVGSGKNSTLLHYSTNAAVMKAGDVVVIDEAGEYSMYASDITRTMPVNGKFTARQKEIYDIVLGAQRAAAEAFVAGKMKLYNVNGDRGTEVTDTLDKVAFDYINTHGKDLHGQPLGKYFLHGLGHSVGIDVHDPMDYTKVLDKGMVFTIEPGIYIPEEEIGVRIEDVVYVDQDGRLVDLMAKLPHETQGIEAAMRH